MCSTSSSFFRTNCPSSSFRRKEYPRQKTQAIWWGIAFCATKKHSLISKTHNLWVRIEDKLRSIDIWCCRSPLPVLQTDAHCDEGSHNENSAYVRLHARRTDRFQSDGRSLCLYRSRVPLERKCIEVETQNGMVQNNFANQTWSNVGASLHRWGKQTHSEVDANSSKYKGNLHWETLHKIVLAAYSNSRHAIDYEELLQKVNTRWLVTVPTSVWLIQWSFPFYI